MSGYVEDQCAFFSGDKCTILKTFYAGKDCCVGCTFFKTKKQAEEDKRKAEQMFERHTGIKIEQYQINLRENRNAKRRA